jgi:hypothetical protein
LRPRVDILDFTVNIPAANPAVVANAVNVSDFVTAGEATATSMTIPINLVADFI